MKDGSVRKPTEKETALFVRISELVSKELPEGAGAFVMLLLPMEGGEFMDMAGYAGVSRARVIRGILDFIQNDPTWSASLLFKNEPSS